MVDKTPSGIWQEFQRDIDYKTKMGFISKFPEYVRFVEGDQWPPPTEKTKNMPRPVINQCDFTVENKQSNILAQDLKMVFTPEELPNDEMKSKELVEASELFSAAAESMWKDADQDELNEDVVNDTLVLGTGVWHFYWDNSIKGGQFTPYVGGMQGETIDPLDLCLGNPQLKPSQIQRQPYIIIRNRKETDALKERAKSTGSDWDKITPDSENRDEKYDNGKQDLDKAYKTTTLTKYYKENDEVYWMEVTENAIIQKPRKLAPTYDGKEKPFTLYPVEILVFKRRKKCSYGRSILADMIPNQRMLNTGLGLMFLSIQQTAWPKIITKVGALLQSITNEPGEIITDHFSQAGVDGIKYMQPPNFSNMPVLLVDKLLELTRQVTGVTEVNTGEVLGANMAASAIMALQSQAKKPNEAYQTRVFRSLKNVGRIYEEFAKCHCSITRPIETKDEDGNKMTKPFTGTEYADTNLNLEISVMPKTLFDDSLKTTMLEKMADRGWITKVQFAKYAPKNSVPQELIQDFEKEQAMAEQQQATQAQADEIMQSLTPDEKAHLQQHPELLNELGGQNG